jgi:ribosomal protein S18 acetylase RimI-like enzyme
VKVSTTTSRSLSSSEETEEDYDPSSVNGVRRAGSPDATEIAALLARAFFEDPVATFLFPDAMSRVRRLNRFFALQLRQNYLRRGVVTMTTLGDGAALWMPPGAPAPTVRERLLHAAFGLQLGRRRAAAHKLTTLLERRHPKEAHWYLGAIGVDPDGQGRGVGTTLLEEMLARSDARREGVYLEASRPESARLYARVGFDLVELLDPAAVGIEGPHLYLMYRRWATA